MFSRNRKWWVVAVIGVLVVVGGLLAAFLPGGSSPKKAVASKDVINAKFTLSQNYGTNMADTVQKFDALVKKYTDGGVNIKLYANSVLGTQTSQTQGVENNTIQFQASGSGLDTLVPAVDTLNLPYRFANATVASEVMNSAKVKKVLWDQFDASGLHFIGTWEVGYNDLLTTKKPINSIADYAGLTVRVANPVIATPQYSAVGADGVSLSSSQVLTALATGTINAVDDPASTMVGNEWYPEAHFVAVTNSALSPDPLMVSETFWNSLSKAYQADLVKAYNGTYEYNLKGSTAANNDAITTMQKAGLTITHPSIAEATKTFAPVDTAFDAKYPAVANVVTAEITALSK